MSKLVLKPVMSVLEVVAKANAVSACHFWGYQPNLPKSLRK